MNAKDLLFIEKILKNKNERKTGDTMEKTQVIFFISTFVCFGFGDFLEGLMSPGSS